MGLFDGIKDKWEYRHYSERDKRIAKEAKSFFNKNEYEHTYKNMERMEKGLKSLDSWLDKKIK